MVLLTFNISLSENQTLKTKNISESELITSIEEKVNSTLLLLELHEFQATFFIDIILAEGLKKSIKSISFAGHEIAFYNSNSDLKIIEKVKQNLEDFLQKPIRGLRQKYHQISYSEIKKLDFNYISNIEESRINFLWRKLTAKTEIHIENDLTIVPESQSPYSQLPFNDYVLQVTPMKYYENMLLESLKNNEYVMIYANIWQLYESEDLPIEIPFYKKINIGRKFEDRLEKLFQFINENEIAVSRMKDYLF
ncbi:polysaccharide deacetylase [Epilithonimonas hispanica]|uniref:Polysaccharide deacetylase n=1 Tax=Epilithonimonas hispanica TaxID=358687 RepID=A0A3D9CXB2_9FLAO|nr:polysaccharide deacetylase [Epilithonimonas hispanica]